jgi:hypothetical protein
MPPYRQLLHDRPGQICVWFCRAPEKVFGLLDCHENLDAMLPALHDILSGVCPYGFERPLA